MYFTELRVENFRNYSQEIVSFHPKVNIITGQNAQGKTNLIESLSLMSIGKSFRTNKDAEMIQFNSDFCRIKASFRKEERDHHIEMVITKEGKSIKIDGSKALKNSDLLEGVYLVVFSPEDLKIVKDEPEKRRKFIDRELCQLKPVYYKSLARYKKILMQRNALLRRGEFDKSSLEVWDQSLAEYGSVLIRDRRVFIRMLDVLSHELHAKITNNKESLQLKYEPSFSISDDMTDQEVRGEFLNRLRKAENSDRARGTTGIGPHRDDIEILVNNVDIRHFGSQGQQRTAALSMKLAELALIKQEKGEDAVLLLDDVLSELDEERKRFLMESLSDVQLFLTTTELEEPFMNLLKDFKGYVVNKGTIEKTFDIK